MSNLQSNPEKRASLISVLKAETIVTSDILCTCILSSITDSTL